MEVMYYMYLIKCNVMLYLIIDMYINIYIYILYLFVDVLMYCFNHSSVYISKTNMNPPLKNWSDISTSVRIF